MAHVADRHDTLVSSFEALRQDPAYGPDWLRTLRASAFARFVERGFPTPRLEDWKFTNIAPVASTPFVRAGEASLPPDVLQPWRFDASVPHQIVVINGRFSWPHSTGAALPAGVTLSTLSGRDHLPAADGLPAPLGDLDGTVTPLVDLNTAFLEDVVVVDVAPGTVVRDPLHLIFITAASNGVPVMASPRLVVRAGEQSQVAIAETYTSLADDRTFTNAVTQIFVGPGATVEHVKLQQEPPTAFHLAAMAVRLGRAATFASRAITLGGRITRNDIVAVLDGEGAECTLNGIYVADDESLVDTHTTIDHAKAHCPSHEVYKGILAGRSRAVFNGKIIVRPDAQKTDAKQTNKALLLSGDAQINTKPQLEIFADDVKCTHGAAIGQLDDDQMFYLRARGIAEGDARNMLIHAFVGEVLHGIGIGAARERARHALEAKLSLSDIDTEGA
jgi:Fe-S cluster assembly protein SufD